MISLGELYLARHNADLAQASLQQAVRLAPQWWLPESNLAIAKLTVKDIPGAIAACQASSKLAPGELQPVAQLALIYEGQGRVDDAIAAYQEWHAHWPDVQAANRNLALLLVNYKTDQHSLDQARDLTATFAGSNDATLLDTNGWVHFKRGEYTDALPVLQHAAELVPAADEVRYHLAMTELRSEQNDRARRDLEAAVSDSQSFRGSADARATLARLKAQSG